MYKQFYLGQLKGHTLNNNEISSHCPFHNDQKPSFSVNVNTGQFICHACGEKGNAFTFAQKLNIPLDLVPGYDPGYKSEKPPDKPVLQKTYDYVDENGSLLFQVCRYNPKSFKQRKPDGNGGWKYNLNGVRRVLYRLPVILKADRVILVEGEKDADNLFKAGFVATTNPGGAGKWKPEYNESLGGKLVYLIPDNDPVGLKHMQQVEESLAQVARSVKIVPLPSSLGPKADVSDFLDQYGAERLQRLIDSPLPEIELKALELSHQEINSFNLTDAGNAELLCKCYGDRVRYLRDKDMWLIWNGHLWQPDFLGKVNLLPEQIAQIRLDAVQAVKDDKRQKDIYSFTQKCESVSRVNTCLNAAKHRSPIVALSADFDRDNYVLGCNNGVLDLRSGQLLNSAERVRVSMTTSVNFDPHAACPRWEQFLNEIFDNDTDLINFITLAAGYSLSGDISEECLFILYGRGANGKSTFLKVLSTILGDYADTTPFSTFISSPHDASRIPNDIAGLNRKRMVIASEIKERSPLNEERIKTLTGGDTLRARYLFREYFSFRPTAKFWLGVNHKPKISDTSDGLWRRIRLVPFNEQFTGDRRDNRLDEKLLAEAPGILNWLVSGCLAWQKHGLEVPDKVNVVTTEYRRESNVIEQFLEDMTVKGPDYKVKATDIFTAWKKWAEARNEHPGSQTRFGCKLSDLGFDKVKNGVYYYKGIGLKEENQGQ